MATITLSNRATAAASNVQDQLALLGRILIAYLFVPSGLGKLMGFAGTVDHIAAAGLPLPQLGAVIAVVIELGFGIALLLGYKTRWTAIAMAVFTVAAALFFHKFWAAPEAQHMMQKINFDKNIAIAGGLLALAAFGPGRYSIDKRGAITLQAAVAAKADRSHPTDMALSRGSQFLYVLESGTSSIGAYQAKADGGLTAIQRVSGLPAGSVGLAAR